MRTMYFGVLLAGLLLPSVSMAADASPAEIAFWQSVANSNSVDELNLYLQTYPNGAYAALARIKIQEAKGMPAVVNTTPAVVDTTTAPTPPTHDISKAVITATPATISVGDQLTVSFDKMPKPSATDKLIVVHAGAPDSTGTLSNGPGAIAEYYMGSNVTDGTFKLGPFAPGKYEIRWLSILYNNNNQLQTVARTAFEVTP